MNPELQEDSPKSSNPGVENFAKGFPRLMLFGDSLTQKSFGDGGWAKAVLNNFERRCDVLNRGFSGYTTAFNKLILPQLLQQDNNPQGSVVGAVILLGSNDSVIKEHDRRHVPLEDYVSNLKEISQHFVTSGVPVDRQVFITPPPLVNEKWIEHCKELGRAQNASYDEVKHYAEACSQLGKELGIHVVDIWNKMQQEKNWEEFLEDGLHFSLKGNAFLANCLIPFLNEMLKDLPVVFPAWDNCEPKNLDNILL